MNWISFVPLLFFRRKVDPFKDEKHNPYLKKAKIIGYTQSTTDQLPKRPKPKYEYRPDYTYSS